MKVRLLLVGMGPPRTGEENSLEGGGTILTPYHSLKESCLPLPERKNLPLNSCFAIDHPSSPGPGGSGGSCPLLLQLYLGLPVDITQSAL